MPTILPLVLALGALCATQTGCSGSHQSTPNSISESSESSSLGESLMSENPGMKVLAMGKEMTTVQKLILPGGCWDYANAVYNRAGYPSGKRTVVFKGSKANGPYADVDTIQPGDWLYYINHGYNGIEHSAIFVEWEDKSKRIATMLSYGGENRKEPARYKSYDLSNVYQITRGKD